MFPKVFTDGTGATTAGTSAVITIPNDSTGTKANKVMVSVGGSTYVLPGSSAAVATTGSIIIHNGHPVIFDVAGITHIAHLQLTAAQAITVVPVE